MTNKLTSERYAFLLSAGEPTGRVCRVDHQAAQWARTFEYVYEAERGNAMGRYKLTDKGRKLLEETP